MVRGKNYYRSVIEPFSPHSQFSPTEKWLYSRISPRKIGYIVEFPPEEWLYSRISPPKEWLHSSPPLNMAWIFNLVALLNVTTTCQCHLWSTISVDGFTSQVACTWMIQMTSNGVSQKPKIGTLYDTPPRFASNWSAKCGSKWPPFPWTLTHHPRCTFIQVNMILQLIVAEIWAWMGTLTLTRTWTPRVLQ